MNDDAHHILLFGVRRSIRYHRRRRGFFERTDQTINVCVLLLSFASAASAGQNLILATFTLGASIAVLTILQIACRFSAKISVHSSLERAFSKLEQELVENEDDETVLRVNEKRLLLDADEPPVKRYVDVMCHNELVRALGYADEHRWNLKWWQKVIAPFSDFGFDEFRKQA